MPGDGLMAKQGKLVEAAVLEHPAVLVLKEENKRLRRKLSKHGAIGELIIDSVSDALADWEPPKFQAPAVRRGRTLDAEAAVCHISDTQIGKITQSYDSEIAHGRLLEYAEKVEKIIDRRRSFARIDELHLYLGGDIIEGELVFPGQAHLIDSGAMQQAVRVAPHALYEMVSKMLTFVKKVNICCVPGNHGRPGSKHAGHHPMSNWDRVAYHTLETLLLGSGKKNSDRISFRHAESFYIVNKVLGHGHLIVHGDQIKGGHAGFPWYGVSKKAQGWIDSIPEQWETLFLGHFHTYVGATLNLRKWYCNGTTESDNEFAQEQLAACGRPVQRLQFWDKEHGLLADCPVWLKYELGR